VLAAGPLSSLLEEVLNGSSVLGRESSPDGARSRILQLHERRDATALRSRLTRTSAPDPEPRSSAAKNVVGRTPTHRPTEHESVILGRPQLHAEREPPAPQHHPRRLRASSSSPRAHPSADLS
jgi:hypothetical protein